MTKYIIGAILCILIICWGLNQYARQTGSWCRGCKYNNMGDCGCPVLCEEGEMWEPEEDGS